MQRLWHVRGTRRGKLALICLPGVALLLLCAWRLWLQPPRVWAARAVPVAFWAWRDELPTDEDVQRAANEARARVLFLRAGQIDVQHTSLRRIRAATGHFPRALPIHLIYNATPDLLAQLAQLDEAALASIVAETFRADAERATRAGAQVVGVQLDIDVPTRLLPRYTRVLRLLRPQLPTGMQLSITGLPTWMDSPALADVLAATDFWIPQCYGAMLPTRLDQVVPSTSPATVAHSIARARSFHHPFYAGLAAYGYAILYTQGGAPIELRGDIDPARIAHDPNFELIERRALTDEPARSSAFNDPAASPACFWRYVFRARREAATSDLAVHAGDKLMLEVPTTEALRACARAARTEAGPQLLGICVFRLPADDDPTNLTLTQIAAALDDTTPPAMLNLHLAADATMSAPDDTAQAQLTLTAANDGATGALLGDDACTLSLDVPTGSVRGIVALEQFTNVTPLCRSTAQGVAPQPCSLRRANVLRLSAPSWQPGARARAVFSLTGPLPEQLTITTTMRRDDDRALSETRLEQLKKGNEP
ncbi:MAG: DUF3142 domain-containing protein [Pyrinomonadaceae bacterium]